MLHENVIYFAMVLNLIGGMSYLIDTLKGKTKPNKITWFLWALSPLIAFAAQIKEGVGLTAFMTFAVGFNPLLIFFASFINKKAQWKLKPFDFVCGALSVVGLILWFITKAGAVAVFFSILSDGLASIPTLIKAYDEPETESALAFILSTASAVITLLTVKTWDFMHIAFPVYIGLVCFIFVLLIQFELGKRIKKILK